MLGILSRKPDNPRGGLVVRFAVIAAVATVAGCGGTERVVTATQERVVTTEATVTIVETRTVEANAPPVYLLDGFQGEVSYKPSEIAIGASNALTQIKWRSYGGRQATGRGLISENSCDPSCAEGQVTFRSVGFRLTRVIACDGVAAYSVLLWDDGSAYDLGECGP